MRRVLLLPSPLLPRSVHRPFADALATALRAWHRDECRVDIAEAPCPAFDALEVLAAFREGVVRTRPDLVVTHSNAGRFAALAAPGVPVVHMDAALPPEDGTPATLAPEAMLGRLADLSDDDDRLPPWSRWWPEEALARVLPDGPAREALHEQEGSLRLSYFRSRLGAPAAWVQWPQAYLAFGDTYAAEVALARRHGWPVRVIEGAGHLHHLVAPEATAALVLRLATSLPRPAGPRGMLPA